MALGKVICLQVINSIGLSLAFVLIILNALACDDAPTRPGTGGLALLRIARVVVPPLPSGLAISSDGRRLVISSHGDRLVTLFDAETYARLGQATDLGDPNGVALSSDGSLAVVGTTFSGTIGFSLPSLERLFVAPFSGRYVVHDPRDDSFYVGGAQSDVVRLSREGAITARFEGSDPRGIALSKDGSQLYFLSALPEPKVFALEIPTLRKLAESNLPIVGLLAIPLSPGPRVLIVGAVEESASPVMTVTFNPETSEVGTPSAVSEGRFALAFGEGSPWAAIEHDVFIPSTIGMLVINQESGALRTLLGPTDFEDLPPCCEVAVDLTRERIIFASFIDLDAPEGIAEVFAIQEE